MSQPVKSLCLILALSLTGIAARAGETPEQPSEPKVANLTPVARDIAQQLGVVPLIEKLQQYKIQPPRDTTGEIDRLKANQALTSKVLIASLQVRDVTARIERELSLINRMRGLLQDRRDRAIKLNSIENIVASGALSEIGNVGSFFTNEVPGEVVQLVAGAATISLGSWALHQQSGGRHPGVVRPNMLAQVFNIPTDKESEYPAFVWTSLNRSVVGGSQTRLQSLHNRWRQFKVIPKNIKTPEGQRRIAILTNTSRFAANIGTFNDQSDMLFDLRSEIFQLDRELLELMQCAQELNSD